MKHNVPNTNRLCSKPMVRWREWKRADGTWYTERGCAWCGWYIPMARQDDSKGKASNYQGVKESEG